MHYEMESRSSIVVDKVVEVQLAKVALYHWCLESPVSPPNLSFKHFSGLHKYLTIITIHLIVIVVARMQLTCMRQCALVV